MPLIGWQEGQLSCKIFFQQFPQVLLRDKLKFKPVLWRRYENKMRHYCVILCESMVLPLTCVSFSKCLSHSCICIETVKDIDKNFSQTIFLILFFESKRRSTMLRGPLGGRWNRNGLRGWEKFAVFSQYFVMSCSVTDRDQIWLGIPYRGEACLYGSGNPVPRDGAPAHPNFGGTLYLGPYLFM